MCDSFYMHTPNVLATNWDRKTEQASVFNWRGAVLQIEDSTERSDEVLASCVDLKKHKRTLMMSVCNIYLNSKLVTQEISWSYRRVSE